MKKKWKMNLVNKDESAIYLNNNKPTLAINEMMIFLFYLLLILYKHNFYFHFFLLN